MPLMDTSPFLDDWTGGGDTLCIAEEAKRLMDQLQVGSSSSSSCGE